MPTGDYFYDEDYGGQEPGNVTCRRCGAEGLHWEVARWDRAGKEVWRLFDDEDEEHVCGAASADDFEDVS